MNSDKRDGSERNEGRADIHQEQEQDDHDQDHAIA
jgi:hypothetical protein